LSTRGQDDTKLKQAIAALWLLTHLGGIGSRSRRCAGSLAIEIFEDLTAIASDQDVPSFSKPGNVEDLKKHLEEGIIRARALYTVSSPYISQTLFDVLSPTTCSIWVLQKERPWRSVEEAMEVIGASLQSGRRALPTRLREIFGLPLAGNSKRRASPLLLRVTKLQEEQYVGVAVLFKTKSEGVSMPDYARIESWIGKDFPKALEVTLTV